MTTVSQKVSQEFSASITRAVNYDIMRSLKDYGSAGIKAKAVLLFLKEYAAYLLTSCALDRGLIDLSFETLRALIGSDSTVKAASLPFVGVSVFRGLEYKKIFTSEEEESVRLVKWERIMTVHGLKDLGNTCCR